MQNINLPKKIIFFLLLYTIFVLNSSIFYTYAQEINSETLVNIDLVNIYEENPYLVSESAVLIDVKTGTVLYDKNMHIKTYPASTTKILTALIALEKTEPTDIITHSLNSIYNIGAGGSNMGMQENEELKMKDALYGVLLKSANEVCMAIAEFISTNVDEFVNLMNEKAKEIGALNTNFANPHGYHDNNHYTTSYDMALLMREAIKNEEFVKIISTQKYIVPKTNLSEEKPLTNSNKLILEDSGYYYEYCIGGKTGFTDEAGNTLVSYAKKDDMELIAVVMKGKGTEIYNDTIKLFEYGFQLYDEVKLFEKSTFNANIPVIQIFDEQIIELGKANLIAENDVILNLPISADLNKINSSINLSENIVGAVNLNDIIGNIEFLYENDIIASVNIISASEINPISEEKLEKEKKIKNFLSKLIKLSILVTGWLITLFIIIILVGFLSRKYFKYRRRKNKIYNYNINKRRR